MKETMVYYPVVFHPENDGSYSMSVPDLPGCFSSGDNMIHAVEMIKEAMGLWLEDYFDPEKEWPSLTSPADIELQPGEFIVMVEFDQIAYIKKYNKKSVKKTLSIPGWLNQAAEAQGLNFSQILQQALKEKLEIE